MGYHFRLKGIKFQYNPIMTAKYIKRLRRFLSALGLIAVLVVVSYYYPNFFLSGKMLYKIGLFQYNQGNHGDYNDWRKTRSAAFYFEKALDNDYRVREVYSRLSHCYWILNDKANAEKTYSLGIEEFPKDAEFYSYRGDCRAELKNYQGAFGDYDSVIKLNARSRYLYDAYFARGAMRYILGDTVTANIDRLQAEKLSGKDLRTYKDYCRIFQ